MIKHPINNMDTTSLSLRPKTSEEIRNYWNVFSSWYTQFMRNKGSKIFSAMVPFLNLQSAKKIAEVGCGPGNGIEILLKNTTDAEIYASDLCDVRANLGIYRLSE